MKHLYLSFFLLAAVFNLNAQSIPSVGIMQFETATAAVTEEDAVRLMSLVIEELRSWGTLNVFMGSTGADYIIRGTLAREGGNFVLSGATLSANEQVLNEYREQGSTVNAISVMEFCKKAAERVPLPNYLLGTWQSTINMPDGPVVCIIQFNSNRTVRIERYDTWEHKNNNSLRYEGFGSGTYSYAGFANRIVTVGSNQIRIDAVISVNLTIEEALTDYSSISRSNLQILFNSERTSFEIVNNTLPCGRNHDGRAVYPSEFIGFNQFRKIR